MATYAIGDIHGQHAALGDLLGRIEPELRRGDTVVFLGDYIDRGPDARGCVERILALRASTPATVVTLLGNHEDWMLRSLRDPTRHSWILGMEALPTIASYSAAAAGRIAGALSELGVRIVTDRVALPYDLFLRAMPPGHLEFFENLVPCHRTPEAVCTHGGCDPSGGPIEGQSRESLLWGADGFPDGYGGPDLIVYGHWNNAEVDPSGGVRPRTTKWSIGIDTIAHGVLTGVRLPGGRLHQSARYALPGA